MKITNVNNIPASLVRAIQSNWYSGTGEERFASVTELIKPTKQLVLERRHWHELTQDASDMIWMLMGSAMHKVVESSDDINCLAEERLHIDIDGAVITGGVDLYEEGVVTDFKFTSVWSYIYGSRMQEWEKQLNLYAYLYRQYGFEVDALQVVAIFRDWQKRKAEQDSRYPRQCETIDIPLWSDDQVVNLLNERIEDIRSALDLPDDLITECSCLERWQPPDQFAVYKTGGSRAMRVFDTEAEGIEYMSNHKDGKQLIMVARKELPKRCFDYCPANKFCHYYQSLITPEMEQAS
jgi:hypothetical protein